MERQIDIESIMQEIRAEAAAKPAYEPGADFEPSGVAAHKVTDTLRRAARKLKLGLKRFTARFARAFVTLRLYSQNQLTDGKNTILDTAAKTDELNGYIHGELETRLAALEAENKALRSELDALRAPQG